MVPVRAASGAAVFAIVIVERDPPGLLGPMSAFYFVKLPGGLSTLAPYLIAGGMVAGVVAIAKVMFRPSARITSTGVSPAFLSLIEDLIAIVGGLLGALYIPVARSPTAAFLLFLLVATLLFYYRISNSRYQSDPTRPAL
jgi:hypothetical protein